MAKICYVDRNFSAASRRIIEIAEEICDEYAADNYDLTLRQLYYQFVARDVLPNTQESYKRLGSIINDARLAGLIDWDHLEDRTRNLQGNAHWKSPADLLQACASQFRLDKWTTQLRHVEVWVEKEALAGIVERAARGLGRVVLFLSRLREPERDARRRVARVQLEAVAVGAPDHEES